MSLLSGFSPRSLQKALQKAFSNPLVAASTLGLLASSDRFGGGCFPTANPFGGGIPTAGWMPQPSVGLSGAPAGKGLQKNPPGWPEGAVKTAGGYTVVPEGNTNWSVYGPDQKPGDKPNTRIWGDPHVQEKDGTTWDFTKNSDFVLPDGTRINCQTSAESGHSVSKGLTITNGADRVNVTGVDGQPHTGPITHDGYEWRAQHVAENPGRDTFHLGGDANNQRWFKETNGVMQGEVTGGYFNSATNRYEQNVDTSKGYSVDPSMRPAIGSNAWGNQLRGMLADFAGQTGDPWFASAVGSYLHADHAGSAYVNRLFGGLPALFGGWDNFTGALGGLGNSMLAQSLVMNQVSLSRSAFMWG